MPEPAFYTSVPVLFHVVQPVQVAVSETPDAGGVAETVQLDAGTTAGSSVVASAAGGVSVAAAVSVAVSSLCPPQAASARTKPAARTMRIANLLLE
jgi:hypothetical protein